MTTVDDSIAAYRWVDDPDPSLQGLSITLVQPAGSDALRRLGPSRSIPEDMTIDQASRTLPETFAAKWLLVQEDELDGWTVLIEPHGWAGATPAVLQRLSDGGRAVNVFWNVNALMHIGWAEDGRVVRSFDPLVEEREEQRLPEEADLPFGEPETTLAAAFVLVERLTGVRIERDWLVTRRRPTAAIPVP